MQKDGTMGPQNPVNLTNQNSTVALANRGGPLQNQARRDLAAKQSLESPEKKPQQGANRGAVGTAGSGGLNVGAGGG